MHARGGGIMYATVSAAGSMLITSFLLVVVAQQPNPLIKSRVHIWGIGSFFLCIDLNLDP
jgi:hypothetical protein